MTFMIELSPDSLATPTRLDLAILEAAMLWPDDATARDVWVRAVILKEGEERLDEMPVELLRLYAKDAISIPRLPELNDGAAKRLRQGKVAGWVVAEAIARSDAGMETGLDALRDEISRALRKSGYQISPQTMKNPAGPVMRFRPVAHLWAEWCCRRILTGDETFPCRRASLGGFLATAEGLRRKGETRKLKRSTTTILIPGEAARLSAGLIAALPTVDICFEQRAVGGEATRAEIAS